MTSEFIEALVIALTVRFRLALVFGLSEGAHVAHRINADGFLAVGGGWEVDDEVEIGR